MLSLILQTSISFAEMAHFRHIVPLDSVIFDKVLALPARSEGYCCFVMVEVFSYDSYSSQWMKPVARKCGW